MNISEAAREAARDVANRLHAHLINPAGDCGRMMLEQSHQLAIDKAAEKLREEVEHFKMSNRYQKGYTDGEREYWRKVEELQNTIAGLREALQEIQTRYSDADNNSDRLTALRAEQALSSTQDFSKMFVRREVLENLVKAAPLSSPACPNFHDAIVLAKQELEEK